LADASILGERVGECLPSATGYIPARVTTVHTAKRGALPNLIVIGAAQCGTSAVHYYLDLHPEIQMSSPKELNFFISDTDLVRAPFPPLPPLSPPQRPVSSWSRGVEWYASQFRASARIRGESSVSYTLPWCPGIAERMASVVPDAKLILLVRDPVERLVSQYLNYRGLRRERRPLAEAVSGPGNAYVARSRYAANLRPFLDRFPRSNIHLDRQEELLERRRQTMQRIFAFLEVDDDFWSANMERLRNTSRRKGRAYRFAERLRRRPAVAPLYRLRPEAKWRIERLVARGEPAVERPAVEPALRRRLVEELESDILELEELTGWDLSAWRAI
jgi:sulfotransferase family protein